MRRAGNLHVQGPLGFLSTSVIIYRWAMASVTGIHFTPDCHNEDFYHPGLMKCIVIPYTRAEPWVMLPRIRVAADKRVHNSPLNPKWLALFLPLVFSSSSNKCLFKRLNMTIWF